MNELNGFTFSERLQFNISVDILQTHTLFLLYIIQISGIKSKFIFSIHGFAVGQPLLYISNVEKSHKKIPQPFLGWGISAYSSNLVLP